MKYFARLCAVFILTISFYGCSVAPTSPESDISPDNFSKVEHSLVFSGVRTSVQPPSHIQFTFSLHSAQQKAVFFDQSDLASRLKILENDNEIDYHETNFFVKTGRTLMQDIVLVLDFSNSMLGQRETETPALQQVLAGSKNIIRALGITDRLAIIEFHDRYQAPQILSYFSSDTSALLATLDTFAQRQIDYGASRAWDAIEQALALFPTDARIEAQRLLLVLSDGRDTSSLTQPEALISVAKQKNIQIFTADLNRSTGNPILQKLTEATGGVYLPADSAASLHTRIVALAENINCQYQVSYVSLLQASQPTVCVQIEHAGQLNSFSQIVDLARIEQAQQDDRIGRLTYDVDHTPDQRAMLILRLVHTPRNISLFRFKLQTGVLRQVQIIPQAAGGLLDRAWQLSQDQQGWLVLQTANGGLPFGAAGALVKFEFAVAAGNDLRVPFALDNTVYPNGKQFIAPDTLILGVPFTNPSPMHGSEGISRQPVLSWQIASGYSSEMVFDFFLDTDAPVLRQVATGVRDLTFIPSATLAANKIHFWKVVARLNGNHYSSPIYQFKTGN